jgi:hypothetical protein
LNDEYVVNPPSTPAPRNRRASSERLPVAAAPITRAMRKEPATFTRKVPRGRSAPSARTAQVDAR